MKDKQNQDLGTETSTRGTALMSLQHWAMIVTENTEWNTRRRTQPFMACKPRETCICLHKSQHARLHSWYTT